jgi:hypothetical protein
MTPRRPQKRYRCRLCGLELPAWLPVLKQPDGSILLHHLGNSHRAEVGAYLERIRTMADVGPVAAEAYEVVEEQDTR